MKGKHYSLLSLGLSIALTSGFVAPGVNRDQSMQLLNQNGESTAKSHSLPQRGSSDSTQTENMPEKNEESATGMPEVSDKGIYVIKSEEQHTYVRNREQ